MSEKGFFFTKAVFEVLDGTTPTPLSHALPLENGGFELAIKYFMNATIDVLSGGQHRSSGPGEREIPELVIDSPVDGDGFVGSAIDSMNDMLLGTSGGTYAARIFTDPNSEIPHFHIRLKYTLAGGGTAVLCCENCEFDGTLRMDGSMRMSNRFRIKGRIFLDGVVISAEIGADRSTIPAWVTA